VAMASAWALLGERPNGAETGGGLLLLVGVLVALQVRRPRGDRTSTPAAEDEVVAAR